MTLNLALVVTGDASGAKKALAETKAELAGITPAATTAGTALDGAGKRAATSTALARHEVTNLSAQIADLGVQIGNGGSPFTAMLQQGPQIAQVLGGRGLTGIIAGVGQGIASLINPVTLTLAAVTGLGYAASWAFSMMRDEASAANLSLEEQNNLIAEAAKRYGEAMPALKAYNDELQRRQELEGLRQAAGVLADRQYEPVREVYPDLQIAYANAASMAQGAGDEPDRLRSLSSDYRTLTETLANGTATGREARDVQSDLLAIFDATKIQEIADTAAQFGELARQIDEANKKAQAFAFRQDGSSIFNVIRSTRSDLSRLNPLDGFNRTPFQSEDSILFERSRRQREAEENKRLGALVPIPTARPNFEDELADRELATQKATDRTQNDYRSVIRNAEERNAQLRLEISLVGETGKAAEAARIEQKLLNDAFTQGSGPTDIQRQAIKSLASDYADLTESLRVSSLTRLIAFPWADERPTE